MESIQVTPTLTTIYSAPWEVGQVCQPELTQLWKVQRKCGIKLPPRAQLTLDYTCSVLHTEDLHRMYDSPRLLTTAQNSELNETQQAQAHIPMLTKTVTQHNNQQTLNTK